MVRVIARLAFLAFAVAPAVATAQTTTASAPTTPPAPPPLQLFQTDSLTSTGGRLSLKSTGFWKPPVSASELPRWTIGWTATANGPGGLAFSAGLSGRRGAPMPLYLSQPSMQNLPGITLPGPGMSRTQWDVTLGATAPAGTVGGMKMKAFGDLILPVPTNDSASPAPILNSRAIRLGLNGIF